MKKITEDLIAFIASSRYENLPEEVVKEAKRALLDSIGCALGGIATEKGKIAVALAKRLGGREESSLIGLGDRVSCANAAFANGELVNSLDYDAISHIPPFVIPPVLAIAESTRASGKDVILSTALGHEISKRLTLALSNMVAKLSKEAKTPDVFGNSNECIFGATTGATRILNLSPEQTAHALGIAAYQCSLPVCRDWEDAVPKSMIKYVPVGWICQGAITATLLAEQGYTANPRVFDGEYGFWRFYGAERWDPDLVVNDLGKQWRFLEMAYKPYPCCRFFHGELDCFIRVIEKNHLSPEEIESVKAFGLPFVANPAPLDVTNQTDAQFSLPFVFSCAAHRIKIGADWQDWDTLRNPKIREFMKKVTMRVDPKAMEAKRNDLRSWFSRVEVIARGVTYVEETMYARWTNFTDLRATDEELVEKFSANAGRLLTQHKIGEAAECILNLERVKDITRLVELITLR
jgi:2-methylcitrate dehydratase